MQDKVTASPLNAWSSAGVFTEMEDTGDKAACEKRREKSNDMEEDFMTPWFALDFPILCEVPCVPLLQYILLKHWVKTEGFYCLRGQLTDEQLWSVPSFLQDK